MIVVADDDDDDDDDTDADLLSEVGTGSLAPLEQLLLTIEEEEAQTS